METLAVILALVSGILLRVGLPLLLTLLIGRWVERQKARAEAPPLVAWAPHMARQAGNCPVRARAGNRCWQAVWDRNGGLCETCARCEAAALGLPASMALLPVRGNVRR